MPGNLRTLKLQAATTLFGRNTIEVHVHKKFEYKATDHEQSSATEITIIFKTSDNSCDFQQQRVDVM